jgi:hypothetical protein
MWQAVSAFLAKIVLALGVYLGGRKAGESDAQREALKRQAKVNDELLDAASRPAARPDDVLGWMRDGGRGS